MRRLFRISLIILVGVGLLWFAARQYLTSQAVTKQVVAHLTELYGGPVSVRQADIGLKHSSIHGAQLFEEGAAPDQAPWLTAETVSADVSLWSLMKGTASPSEVQLTGAKVTLRFDSDGRLLTRLPGRRPSAEGTPLDKIKTLPHLHAEQSEVTLHKEGHPDIILKNVKLDASPKEGRFVLHGTGENTEWGQLILDGMLGPKNELALTLKTAGQIQITQTMLDALPLVPASIWRDVQAEGITAATLTVRREADATTHYRVELEPRDTRVTVPVAALKGTNASGKLVIEDGVVRLRDVKGQAYEGTLQIDADLDFRGAVTQLDFSRLDAHGLDVRQLPESWGLPEQLEGRLDASGDVHLTLEQGKVSTTGAARGEIRDARIAGQSVDGPIELQLAPEGPPLQADPKEDRVFAEPVLRQRDSLTQAQSASDGTHHTSPERQRRDQATVPSLALRACVSIFPATVIQLAPVEIKQARHYLTVKLKLDKADLHQIVEKFKIDLPFSVTGRVSFQGQVAIPVNKADKEKTVRFQGKAIVTDAALGEVKLARAETDAAYEDGLLRLDNLSGSLRGEGKDGKETLGNFKGVIQAQIVPAGDLTAKLAVEGLDLHHLAATFKLKEGLEGTLSTTVSVRVPLERLEKAEAWEATGRVTVPTGQAFGMAVQDGTAEVGLKDGVLSLADVRARVAGAALTGMGEIHLKPPYHYQARIDVRGTEAAELPQLPEAARSTVVVEGRATVAARLQGTLDPWKLDTSGTASIAGLKIDVLKLQDISLTWEGDGDRIMVKDLRAQLEGGKVTGKAVVPLRPTVAGSGDLTLKDVDVGELLKRQNLPLPVEGKADGVVKGTIPAAEPGQERPVSVAVDLKASRLLVQGIEADGLQGKLNYADGELAYDLEAKTLGGRLQVEGKVPREVHEGQEVKGGTLKLQGARLEWLSGLFKVRADEFPLSGLADATLTFRHKGPDRALVGTGHFQVTDVTWEAMDWLPNLQGDLELTRERLLVSEATGTLAQGIVRGRMGLALKPGIPSWFVLNLDRAEASRLLAPWPAFRDAVHGSVDVELRGRFGSEWAATGVVVMNRGKVAGIEANSWRLPLAIAHVAATGRGRLELRDGGGELAQGHSTLRATYRWGGEHRLEGALRFTNMNLRGVLHEATERTYLGGGRMTGRVDFAAPGLASLNDLNAVLDATLAQPQPSGLPVLKQLSPVLRISTSSSFQSGKVRARLSHGVVRFERLVLEGGPGDLSITGTVTTRGRLDLDVRANLPSLVLNTNALGMVGVRLPVQAAVPGRMLNRAPPLANRNMRLQVTGTLRDPTVRILPLSLLGA